jgi:predicted metal-dependent hydrolase
VATPRAEQPNVVVRRSARRRKTVSAYRDGDSVVVLMPARFSATEERRWITDMLARLAAQDGRRRRGLPGSDAELVVRAKELSELYLEGRVAPVSVRWVTNQHQRWGSCTPGDSSIRLSTRLRDMPAYIVDYVLVHELAHLIVAGHGERFWAWVRRFPQAERARGYLEGVEAAAGLPLDEHCDDTEGS